MTHEILHALTVTNLAAGAAILAVLALRHPARRLFGARAAYALWLAVPLAALAVMLPARIDTLVLPAAASETIQVFAGAPMSPTSLAAPFDWNGLATGVWAVGVIIALVVLAWSQWRFMRGLGRLSGKGQVRRAQAHGQGPAVVGALFPRLILPADFETRFDADEQAVILAHEGAHLSAGHARANGLVALAQCLCWFNPLIHIAAVFLRIDQELACDAAVLARHPTRRRLYAQALLKTQLAPRALPLGCYWPVTSAKSLKERIAMLKQPLPSRAVSLTGGGAVLALALAAGAAAWAAQPVRLVIETPASPSAAVIPPARPAATPAIVLAAASPPAPAVVLDQPTPTAPTPAAAWEGSIQPSSLPGGETVRVAVDTAWLGPNQNAVLMLKDQGVGMAGFDYPDPNGGIYHRNIAVSATMDADAIVMEVVVAEDGNIISRPRLAARPGVTASLRTTGLDGQNFTLNLTASLAPKSQASATRDVDLTSPVSLRGRITGVDTSGANALLRMEVAQASPAGQATGAWLIRVGSPATLARMGFTAQSMKDGGEVTVLGYRLADKSCAAGCTALGHEVTFADGKAMFFGVDNPASAGAEAVWRAPTGPVSFNLSDALTKAYREGTQTYPFRTDAAF